MTTTLSDMWNRGTKTEKAKRNRAAFWIGVGSLFDLRGDTSYYRMQKLMMEQAQKEPPSSVNLTMLRVNQTIARVPVPSPSPRT